MLNTSSVQFRTRRGGGGGAACMLAITTGLLCLFVVIMDEKWLRPLLPIVYFVQILAIVLLVRKYRSSLYGMLSPSGIGLLYVNISLVFGALAFHLDQIVSDDMMNAYLLWGDLPAIVTFFLIANFGMALPMFWFRSSNSASPEVARPNSGKPVLYSALLSLILALSLVIDFSFAAVFRICVALAILHNVFSNRMRLRWGYVFIVVMALAIASSDSKRNAIFIVLPAIWLEHNYYTVRKIGIKQAMLFIALGIAIFYLILAMSVMRGYGLLDPKGFFDALTLVPTYLGNPNVWAFLANNFEISSVFFSSHNSVHMINVDSSLIAYGETVAKAFFVGIPEGVFNYKPESILELYTREWDPTFRSGGGSYPITLLSEMYWNFAWLGLFGLVALSYGSEKLYAKMTDFARNGRNQMVVFLLSLYVFFLFLVRGSGLDIFVAYTLIAAGVVFVFIGSAKKLSKSFGG
jgi:hypothetical protein